MVLNGTALGISLIMVFLNKPFDYKRSKDSKDNAGKTMG